MKKLAITIVVVVMSAGICRLWADPEGIWGESLIEITLEPLDDVQVTLWYGPEGTFEGNTEDSPDGNQYRAYNGAPSGSKWLIHIPYGHSYYVTGYKYDPEWPWYSEHYGPFDYESPNDSHHRNLIMWQED